ncbi:adhesion G-protein coupled receptor G5-like [Pseudorasbora parva]|uniref:adhesion G-protein coupled receptor G5-like n=1 Tax=Pseudorasbora parva TaxID=51549 RepID=UPI00351E312B
MVNERRLSAIQRGVITVTPADDDVTCIPSIKGSAHKEQSCHNFNLHEKAARVEDMKLLLLLIMIYGVDRSVKETKAEKNNTSTKNEELTRTITSIQTINPECERRIKDNNNNYSKLQDSCLLMKSVKEVKQYCSQQQQNKETKKFYNRMEKGVIQACILTMELQIYNFMDFAMIVVKMNQKIKGYEQITAPSVSNETQTAKIWLPVEPFQNFPEDQQKVGIVTYHSDQQFNLNNSIMSKVIRIEVPGRDVVNLTNPLIMHFPVKNYTNNTNTSYIYSCQYYDEKGNDTWKTDGCNTTQLRDDVVQCSCNHMTPFAVLLVEVNNIDEQQWKILSVISYVGCSLSAIFSAFSILMFIFNRKARAEVSSSIHVSLSGALFLLNISFMLSEWAATLQKNEVCVFIAVMIHYSLLSCFTWMAVEALHLYLLLIRVFNIYVKYYMIKLSLIGWGVPAVVVGSFLLIHITYPTRPFYGTKDVTFSNSNATNAACWITEPVVLYGVNLSYFTVVFLFNLMVLLTVSRQIFKLKQVDLKKQKKIPVKDVGTVLGLMCLLGITWGLVFLSSGYINYPILYLFCIFNTMQGASIFLWMCLTARQGKQKADHTKSLSNVDTFTSEKQKE